MFPLILLVACSIKPPNKPQPQPQPIKEGPETLPRGLDAYITKVSIDIAKCDGNISEKERTHIFQKHGPSFDPILFHAVNRQQGIEFIAATKKHMHSSKQGRDLDKPTAEWIFNNVFEFFLNEVASADGNVHPTETKAIKKYVHFIYQIQDDEELRTPKETDMWINKVSRGELPLMLDTIRNIQQKQKAAKGSYVAFDEQPPRQSPATPRKWIPKAKDKNQTFPWELVPPLRGTYWVDVNENGFKAYGAIDVDGDGIFATYMATAGAKATPLTEDSVY